MTLTRQDIVNAISSKVGYNGQISARLAQEVIELICDGIVEDRKVLLTGFGRFEALSTKPRKARYVRKGTVIPLGERVRVKFKPSDALVARLNEVRREYNIDIPSHCDPCSSEEIISIIRKFVQTPAKKEGFETSKQKFNKIERERLKLGLAVSDLCSLAGVSRGSYYNLKLGSARVTQEMVRAFYLGLARAIVMQQRAETGCDGEDDDV